jgi:adenosylhomocysteinase
MKDGAILANAGHFDIEIDKVSLQEQAVSQREVRKDIVEYRMEDGRNIYLLAEGRLVNLAAGDGHPAEIMDMTFALQALSLVYVDQFAEKLGNQVVRVPFEIDEQVAHLFLEANGIEIDVMSKEQQNYQESWEL